MLLRLNRLLPSEFDEAATEKAGCRQERWNRYNRSAMTLHNTTGSTDPQFPKPTPSGSGLTVVEMAELAGGLAHELRNPLSTMMINLKLLDEDLRESSTPFDSLRRRALLKLDIVRKEGERLQHLFGEFLSLAGPYRLKPLIQDLNALVSRLASFFDPVARSGGIELVSRLHPNTLLCSVDEQLLSQALLNLVINAQQAMPEGGYITVRAMIVVADTGVGIGPDDRERIFRPFFSTKPRGTGLGLSITQRIVHDHGGKLTLATELGRGTTFMVWLPLPSELRSS